MLDKLLEEGYIRKIKTKEGMVDESLKLASRDLLVAREIININADWAFNISYNSILQALRALMFKNGYRPSTRNSHVAMVKFASVYLPHSDVLYLERMRRKRHKSVYDMAGVTSLTEAENAIKKAEEMLDKVKVFILE